MRILVFGGTGMLGRAVAAEGRRRGAAVLALSHAQADLTDRDRLFYWAKSFHPETVVNCAAFTRVDDCESEPERAELHNGRAVGHAAEAAEAVGAELLHVSSDYVFDGEASEPYAEDAATGPISVYGQSKLSGERHALRYDKALVVRASWLFGPGGPNFAATMRRLLLEGKVPLRVVDDQVGRPTYTPFLARALWELAGRGLTGILHYGNREAVSWHGFAREIARYVRPGTEVVPVATSEFPRPAPRPAYSVLDVSRFEEIAGRPVEPWVCGLAAYLDSLGEFKR